MPASRDLGSGRMPVDMVVPHIRNGTWSGTPVPSAGRAGTDGMAGDDPDGAQGSKVGIRGELTMRSTGDPGARVQVVDRSGTVLADSDPKGGAAYLAYTRFRGGSLSLDLGNCMIRVIRDTSEASSGSSGAGDGSSGRFGLEGGLPSGTARAGRGLVFDALF